MTPIVMAHRKSKKSLLGLLLSTAMTLLLGLAVFSELSLTDFYDILYGTSRHLLVIYLFLNLTSMLVRARRSQLMVRTLCETVPRFRAFLLVTAIRNAFVDLLPARLGELSYVYVLARFGIPALTGFSTFLLAIALDIVVLSLFVAAALKGYAAVMLKTHISPLILTGVMVSIAAALLSSLYAAGKHANVIAAYLSHKLQVQSVKLFASYPRLTDTVISLATAIEATGQHLSEARQQGTLWLLISHTVTLRLLKYTSLYVLLIAVVEQWNVFPADLPFIPTTLAFVFAEGAASLPVGGLMGFGAYEGAWSMLFSSVCGQKCSAMSIPAIAFAIHLITQVTGYVIGFLAVLIFLFWEWRRRGLL